MPARVQAPLRIPRRTHGTWLNGLRQTQDGAPEREVSSLRFRNDAQPLGRAILALVSVRFGVTRDAGAFDPKPRVRLHPYRLPLLPIAMYARCHQACLKTRSPPAEPQRLRSPHRACAASSPSCRFSPGASSPSPFFVASGPSSSVSFGFSCGFSVRCMHKASRAHFERFASGRMCAAAQSPRRRWGPMIEWILD